MNKRIENNNIRASQVNNSQIQAFKKPKKSSKHLDTFFYGWHNPIAQELTIIFCIIFAAVFITLGFVIISKNNDGFRYEFDYTDLCKTQSICVLPAFTFPTTEHTTFFVQYKLINFQQNHYKFMSSIPRDMLVDGITDAIINEDCSPYLTNSQMKKTRSVTGTLLDPTAVAIPCGMAAYALFTDTFQLTNVQKGLDIPISGQGISWKNDIDNKFNNIDLSKQWIDIKNERFINWMRTSPYNDFIKTWGRVDETIQAGKLQFTVRGNWLSDKPNLRKSIIFTTGEFYGTPNDFLSICYLFFGFYSLIFGMFLIVDYVRIIIRRRKNRLEDNEVGNGGLNEPVEQNSSE